MADRLHGLSTSNHGRSVSAPIPIRPHGSRSSFPESSHSSLSRSQLSNEISGASSNIKESLNDVSLDLTGLLQRSEPLVVKTRTGSVLSRGFILKTDYYPSGNFLCHLRPPFSLDRV